MLQASKSGREGLTSFVVGDQTELGNRTCAVRDTGYRPAPRSQNHDQGANLHDAIEMAHSGRPNRRKRRSPLVETIDMRAIFRSKCRQASHENRHWELG